MSLLSWRAVLVVTITVATGALAPVPGSADSTPSLQGNSAAALRSPTRVLRTSPVNASGALRQGYRVADRARGSCFATSAVHGRAFRCIKGNLIQDPCWKQTRRRVACLDRPWASRVTVLRLTRGLPGTHPGSGVVWGLRVAGGIGRRCLFVQGASGVVRGRRLNYHCGGRWWLLGHPNRQRRVWTILSAKQVGRGFNFDVRGRKPVTTAWRAVVP